MLFPLLDCHLALLLCLVLPMEHGTVLITVPFKTKYLSFHSPIYSEAVPVIHNEAEAEG